jgi:hypothetical protein
MILPPPSRTARPPRLSSAWRTAAAASGPSSRAPASSTVSTRATPRPGRQGRPSSLRSRTSRACPGAPGLLHRTLRTRPTTRRHLSSSRAASISARTSRPTHPSPASSTRLGTTPSSPRPRGQGKRRLPNGPDRLLGEAVPVALLCAPPADRQRLCRASRSALTSSPRSMLSAPVGPT